MVAKLPDRKRSYAVIIGVSEYEDKWYPRVAEIEDSAEKLASLISSKRMWHLPKENVRALTGRVTVAEAAAAIEEVTARDDMDGLFIYLCMHGRRWTVEHVPDRELHFALSDSVKDRPFTHLPFRWLRWRLTKKSKAANTVLVIDSCWSDGTDLGEGAHLSDGARPGAEQPEPPKIRGKCTMTATRERRPADTKWLKTNFTAFSGAMIEVIENGIEGQGECLTPKMVYNGLREKLAASHPEPDWLADANGDDVFLCRNNQFVRTQSHVSLDELLDRLDGPDPVQPASYATAIEEACKRGERLGTVQEVLVKFADKCKSQDVLRLSDRLRSCDATVVNEQADRLIDYWYLRRSGPDIADLIHQLHELASKDIDAREVLGKVEDRSPEITADLSASLREAGCRVCTAIGRRVDGQMLDVWPPEKHAELLAVLH